MKGTPPASGALTFGISSNPRTNGGGPWRVNIAYVTLSGQTMLIGDTFGGTVPDVCRKVANGNPR